MSDLPSWDDSIVHATGRQHQSPRQPLAPHYRGVPFPGRPPKQGLTLPPSNAAAHVDKPQIGCSTRRADFRTPHLRIRIRAGDQPPSTARPPSRRVSSSPSPVAVVAVVPRCRRRRRPPVAVAVAVVVLTLLCRSSGSSRHRPDTAEREDVPAGLVACQLGGWCFSPKTTNHLVFSHLGAARAAPPRRQSRRGPHPTR